MIEWDRASTLRSPLGDLDLNQTITVGGNSCIYLVDPGRSKATRGMRATVDNVPQGDGEIFHRRFSNGVEFALVIQLWETTNLPACDELARLMQEELVMHLEAMKNDTGRYLWQPTNYGDERMLDEARWLVDVDEALGEGQIWELTFTIDSPLPYVIDSTQASPTISGTSSITNNGNVPFFPVIQPQGAFTDFTITNNTTGLTIVYDDDRPGAQSVGASDYAEIDTFRNSIYLNGDEDNLAPGIDPLLTDYFVLEPGLNSITCTGASCIFLVNHAWHP